MTQPHKCVQIIDFPNYILNPKTLNLNPKTHNP
jgi:hypothetical protein